MDEIQKVLVKAGRKDLVQKYYKKVAGIGYELYAKGLDRVSTQCATISDNAKVLAKLVRENADDRKKKNEVSNDTIKNVIILEEHLETGGISSTIADFIVDNNINIRFKRFGIKDYIHDYGKREVIAKKIGLDVDTLTNKIEEFINGTKS